MFLLSNERGWTVFSQFMYVVIYLLPLCQKPVWEAVKKIQRVLMLIRNLAWLKNFKRFLDTFPSCFTEPDILLWKDSTRHSSFGGHPLLVRILNKTSLLTIAFVRSMNEIYNGIFCSLHFSCSWRAEKKLKNIETYLN